MVTVRTYIGNGQWITTDIDYEVSLGNALSHAMLFVDPFNYCWE